MTEPILTATTHKRPTGAAARHPLATRTGIDMMANLLEAGRVWRRCTKPQRALLEQLCPPVAERLVTEGSLTTEDMPRLPERVGKRSVEAMQRRGLCDDSGRLTGRAVHTWYYRPKRGEA